MREFRIYVQQQDCAPGRALNLMPCGEDVCASSLVGAMAKAIADGRLDRFREGTLVFVFVLNVASRAYGGRLFRLGEIPTPQPLPPRGFEKVL